MVTIYIHWVCKNFDIISRHCCCLHSRWFSRRRAKHDNVARHSKANPPPPLSNYHIPLLVNWEVGFRVRAKRGKDMTKTRKSCTICIFKHLFKTKYDRCIIMQHTFVLKYSHKVFASSRLYNPRVSTFNCQYLPEAHLELKQPITILA
jgi:hypothetical protein